MFTDENLYLPAEGRLPWNKKGVKPMSQCRPQLRLFATELAFLTLVASRTDINKCIVVYAGAARGHHIPALASLYPSVPFYLYDPHDFAISATPQITIFRDRFTDRMAEQWRQTGRTIIFISDVRTMNKTDKDYEIGIGIDMNTQARWVEIMKPLWWSLKFRIPYPIVTKGESYVYLPGWLMFQPFSKNLSMEMRLIGQSHNPRGQIYDSRDLEQQLYYHNTQVRPNLKRFANGYDNAYLLHVVHGYRMSESAVLTSSSQNLHRTSESATSQNRNDGDDLKFIEDIIDEIGC